MGVFSSETKSSTPKTDMFSNVLFIDLSRLDESDNTDNNITLNGIGLDKRFTELDDYYGNVNDSSLEVKCNADKTECSYYKDGELVHKKIIKDSFESFTSYKGGIPIVYRYKNVTGGYYLCVLDDLKVGTNSLKVKITAENGDERVYTFNIIRKDADGKVADNDIMPPQTGNTIYVIAVIMLVLSFGVGIYFYTKKIKNTI